MYFTVFEYLFFLYSLSFHAGHLMGKNYGQLI